ncbi:hypothetical protein [Algoriphagus vanfongensis]|uniref:hypothetical protein n=1 Tax=Algoriphagus vanfongensis TaxID=426371 RepID=UPI00047E0EB3|nr:hypothetical protein [Algoriphagus vanfongensis]
MSFFLRLVVLFVVLFGISSCSRKSWDNSYKDEDNYESFYVVDTILIENPVYVSISKRGLSRGFYMSEKDLNISSNLDLDEMARDSKVYFSGGNLLGFFPGESFVEILDSCSNIFSIKKANKEVILYYSDKPIKKFVLALSTLNYYNQVDSSLESWNLESDLEKSVYIKVVFPLCE